MDFDHREGTTKDRGGVCVNYHLSMKRMLAEIAKCDLVCVTCHRHRTYCRREGLAWYPLRFALALREEPPSHPEN